MIYGIKTPCYNCNDRKLRCHSDCKRYLEFKNENDKRVMKMLIDVGIVDTRRIDYIRSKKS